MHRNLKKKFDLVHKLLCTDWRFDPEKSEDDGTLLIFTRGSYEFGLARKGIYLAHEGGVLGELSYKAVHLHHKKPTVLINVTPRLQCFDLADPDAGLLPPEEVYGDTVFRGMLLLLHNFVDRERRAPTITEFLKVCHRSRNHEIPADYNKIHQLIKIGSRKFWYLYKDERRNRITLLPLRPK
jgi:hypothetical protein